MEFFLRLKLFVEILQIVEFKVIKMIRTDHYIEDLESFFHKKSNTFEEPRT